MSRPTTMKVDGTVYWAIFTYTDAGVLADADSTPTVAVRKNGGSTADVVTVTKRSATTGIYDCSHSPSGEVDGDTLSYEETATMSSQAYLNRWTLEVTSSDANVLSISGNTAAGTNLSAQFDGTTGLIGDLYPATQAAVQNIGSAGPSQLNYLCVEDNISAPIKGRSFVGNVQAGTYLDLANEDGVVMDIDDQGNNVEIVYGFSLGGDNEASSVEILANVDGNGDQLTVQAYNFVDSVYETIGVLIGSGGSAFKRLNVNLLARHTGTAADLGRVYISFTTTTSTPNTLYVDKINVGAVTTSKTIGYVDASVWVNTISGTAGSEAFVNGVADNPTTTYASANLITAEVGLNRYTFSAGDNITLTQSHLLDSFFGYNYTLNMNSQVAPNFIEGAEILGVTTNTMAHYVRDCRVGTVVTPYELAAGAVFVSSGLVNLKLKDAAGAALDVEFLDCHGNTQGSMFPGGTIDFGTTAGTNHEVSFQRWGGPVTLVNMKAGDIVYFHGNGTAILDASCTGGSFRVAGMINLVDNSGGAVGIVEDGRITKSGVAAEVWDTVQSSHTTVGTFGYNLDAQVSAAGGGGLTVQDIVDGVWDEATSSHDIAGTFGKAVKQLNEGAVSTDGTVVNGSSSTEIATDLTSLKVDFYAGMTIVFTSGANAGQSRVIIAYSQLTNTITVDEPLSNVPAFADEFIVLTAHVHSVGQLVDGVWLKDLDDYNLANTSSQSIKTMYSYIVDKIGLTMLEQYGVSDYRFVAGALTEAPSGGGGGDATAANQATIIADIAALNDFNPALDTVAHVTLVDTTTDLTNGGAGGGDATLANQNTILANQAVILADTNELQSNQGDWATATTTVSSNMRGTDGANTVTPNTIAPVDVSADVSAILLDTAELQANQNNWLTATTTVSSNMRGTDNAILASSTPSNWSTLIVGTGVDAGKVTTSNPASGGGSAHTAQDVANLILAVPTTPLGNTATGSLSLVDTTTDLTNGGSGGDDAATIYSYFTAGSNEDAFKADVSGLSTSAEVQANGILILGLNDFDPASDTVAHVTLVDTTTDLTNGGSGGGDATLANQVTILANQSTILADTNELQSNQGQWLTATTTVSSNMRGTDGANTVTPNTTAPDNAGISANGVAIAALNDFDPALDTVAHVTLVDTTTDLTNGGSGGGDCPTVQEIVDGWGNQPQGVYTTPDTLGFYLDAQVSTAGSGGTGLYQATVRIQDSSNNSLQGARVNIDGTTLTLTTGTSGEVTFNLDSGVYLLEVSPPAGYDTPVGQVLTVSSGDPSDTTFTLTGTSPPTECSPPWIG